jgi:hypothetical protein
MEEQLRLLIELQEVDGKIRAIREEKKKMPDRIAALEQKSAAGREALAGVKAALEEAQKAKRDRDRDLEDGGRKVEKLKARTSEIKTNKEYQAMLKEIEAAEQENRAIEDDILKLMEKIDAAAAEIKVAEQRSGEEAAAVQAERRELEERMAMLDSELSADEQVRRETASKIPAPLLAQYQRLYAAQGGKVVVEARGESCSGCYMSIPPQVYVNVKKNESIISCPHCHRILYYKEAILQK